MAEPTRFTFDEAILGVIKERQRREADAERLKQEMQFNNRQLTLLDNYRQQQVKLDQAKTINDINANYIPTDALTGRQNQRTGNFDVSPNQSIPSQGGGLLNQQFGIPAFNDQTNYIRKDLIPKTPKSQKGATLIPMYGGQVEQNFETNPQTGERVVTGYGNFYRPDKTGGGSGSGSGDGKTPDISGSVGEINKLLTLYNNFQGDATTVKYVNSAGEQVDLNKNSWRTMISDPVNKALTKAGVPQEGDIVKFIKSKVTLPGKDNKDPNIAQTARKNLLDVINKARYEGVPISGQVKNLTDTQYEALKYWAESITR